MNALELGTAVVALCRAGQDEQVLERYYADDIVSVEGQGTDAMPARIEGVEAVKQKWAGWYANTTVHGTEAHGPFIGYREDQFMIRFVMDTTPKGGERSTMDEVALYTVANGKIVEEVFFYNYADDAGLSAVDASGNRT
ncbi:MAG: nuclear transport factor 2 family protein [Pseudomonadota bacterium]